MDHLQFNGIGRRLKLVVFQISWSKVRNIYDIPRVTRSILRSLCARNNFWRLIAFSRDRILLDFAQFFFFFSFAIRHEDITVVSNSREKSRRKTYKIN